MRWILLIREAQKATFVLFAGGLRGPLGYIGIKVDLPIEIYSGTCFLQHLSSQLWLFKKLVVDLYKVIIKHVFHMYSTHRHAPKLLKQESSHAWMIMMLGSHNKYRIQTKPYGHVMETRVEPSTMLQGKISGTRLGGRLWVARMAWMEAPWANMTREIMWKDNPLILGDEDAANPLI